MLLTAYGDEAGTHESSTKTVVALLVGSVQSWDSHRSEWAALLDKHGLDYLHAVDMLNRTRQYSGWDYDRIAEVLTAANNITERNVLFGVVATLTNDDFAMVYRKGKAPQRAQLDSKYGICFRYALSNVLSFLRGHHGEEHEIDVMMESGAKNGGAAKTIFDQIKKYGDDFTNAALRSSSIGDKKKFVGLQAADLIAYPAYKLETAFSVMTLDGAPDDVELVKTVRCPMVRASITAGVLEEHKNDLLILDQFDDHFKVVGRHR